METPIRLNVDRLRVLREQRGWSQRELARRSGFGQSLIRKYEAGMIEPSAIRLGMVAEALGVSVDYLLGRTDAPQVHISENELSEDETILVKRFRHEGWPGVVRLGAERIPK